MAGDNHSQGRIRNGWGGLVWAVVFSLLLGGCSVGAQVQDKTYTIGIISYSPLLDSNTIEGLKAGMAELGYVEGENVTYIHNGAVEPNPQAVDAEIENLLAQNVDMLFAAGNVPAARAKQAVAGTDIPVVFAPCADPVGEGIVESIAHPAGNLTGVQVGFETPKALEWLVTITPEANKVYVPYNPDDDVSVVVLPGLEEAASQLGIELVLDEVRSVEEAVAAIESLPEDVDAIFRIASPTLDPKNSELTQAAIKQGLPMAAGLPLDEAVLLVLTCDLVGAGKQAARLVHQVHQGVNPGDLPVETAEIISTINLKTAEAIGLYIPDEILEQADIIIR